MTDGRYLCRAALEGVSVEYIEEARSVAQIVKRMNPPGSEEHDLAQYADRLIQEVYALRSRVAYLEGWKEGAEKHHTSDVSTQRDELEKRTR